MSAHKWIALGIMLFVAVLLSWASLAIYAGWPWPIVAGSCLPLLVTLLSMTGLAPKPFFYAALVLMLYIAFAISQIIVVTQNRWLTALVLGAALAYLAVLKFVLQALNSRRQILDQESSSRAE